MEMIGPMIGLFCGVCLVLFRKFISNFIKKGYEKFPKYEYGIKTLKIGFDLNPNYILFLGILICMLAILGFLFRIGLIPA